MERPRDERVLWDFMRNVDGGKEKANLTLEFKTFRDIYLAMWKLKPERRELTTPTGESRSWHLSLNHKCIKWLPLEKKKKRKIWFSLLVLGTGSGDVLALAAQLKWRINYCHPAGSFSGDRLCNCIARFDGMICQTNSATRSLLGKFRASTKAISCMVFSHDGKRRLATAAGQASLKVFNCSDNKKILGHHPGGSKGCCLWEWDDPPSQKEAGTFEKQKEVKEEARSSQKPNEAKQVNVEELRSWLVMKKEITNEVVYSMLFKLEDLTIDN